EPAVAADTEFHVAQTAPGVVALAKQQPRLHTLAVAHSEGLGSRARDVLLDVLEMYVDGRMSAGAVPVLEHVRVAVDDHSGHLRSMRDRRQRASRSAELLHVMLEQPLD